MIKDIVAVGMLLVLGFIVVRAIRTRNADKLMGLIIMGLVSARLSSHTGSPSWWWVVAAVVVGVGLAMREQPTK